MIVGKPNRNRSLLFSTSIDSKATELKVINAKMRANLELIVYFDCSTRMIDGL